MKLRILVVVLVVASLGWLGKELLYRTPPYFPDIAPGAYVGQLSGIDSTPRTIFLERFENSDTFLFVLFREGFKPLAVFGERENDKLRPLTVADGAVKLSLRGAKREEQISGVVESSDGRNGNWELRALKTHELIATSEPVELARLKRWLVTREENRRLRQAVERSLETITESEKKRDKLQALLSDEDSLREKAAQRRAQLTQELQTAISERKATSEAVDALVSELELLGRITKRGQVVALARRVMNRENRWYEVNWKANEDTSALDDSEVPPGVDLANLESAVKRANEVRALIRERDEELRKINEIQDAPQEVGPGIEPPPPPLAPEMEPTQPKNLWNRLFG